MEGRRRYTLVLLVCAAWVAPGSGCRWLDRRSPPPPMFPAVLQPGASLSQVTDAVNHNSRSIRSFATHEVEFSGPGIPITLRGASIVFQRPKRLRIQAGTMMGPELDVGSNDELFWFWVKRSETPAVFFCRHDRYAACDAARQMPIDPKWLIEAFGIVEFAPEEQHRGPITRPDGRLEILTTRQTPCGPATKKTVIDASTALVGEQHLYDYRGQLIASVVVREHRLDPLTNLVMPKIVDLQYPQAQFSMLVNLGNVTINQPIPDPSLWAMPQMPGWPFVDLANPNWRGIFDEQPVPTRAEMQSLPPTSVGLRRGYNRLR